MIDSCKCGETYFCGFFLQPHQPVQEKKKPSADGAEVDHRSVDDLLTFINGQKIEEERLATKSKAQKRARQKQKKVSVATSHSCGGMGHSLTNQVPIPVPSGRKRNV